MPKSLPFDDNVHYVKKVGPKDRHPMKWIVRSHKEAKIKTDRRAPTLDEAIELARRMTKVACEKSKDDLILHYGRKPKKTKEATPKLESFNSDYFTCICANPVAQVWQCTHLPDEKKSSGRKARDGTKKQPTFKHLKGECAVLMGETPVREADGTIRVFKNWQEAEEYTYGLYCQADELGETITWREGNLVVDRLTNVEIIFDPSSNGEKTPFSLWFPKYAKPYYRQTGMGNGSRLASVKDAADTSLDITSLSPAAQQAHAFNRRLDQMAAEERKQSRLTMQVAVFRTIWEAEKQAIKLEREYFNNLDY